MYGPVIPLYIWKKNSEIILIGALYEALKTYNCLYCDFWSI